MSVEITDWISASLVLVGSGLLSSEDEIRSFSSQISSEIAVESPFGSEGGLLRRIVVNKDRIAIDLLSQRGSIKQEYPPDDPSKLVEIAAAALQHSENKEGITAHGYNVELVYNQESYPTAYEYIANKLLMSFSRPSRNVLGASVQLRLEDNDARMWNIDIQPRFRRDDTNKVYCSVNLHIAGPPDVDGIHTCLADTRAKAKTFIEELDS